MNLRELERIAIRVFGWIILVLGVIALSHGDEADGFLKLAVATLAFSNSRKEKTE